MRARTPGRARVKNPGPGVDIHRQSMAVSIDDRPGRRKTSAQQAVTIARIGLMTVDHDQMSAGQRLIQPFRQMHEQLAIFLRPFARDIVIAEHRQHPPQPGLKLGEDGGMSDVAAMHGQVALAHQLLDARIERAVRIGQDGDTQPIYARKIFRMRRTWFHRLRP